MYQKTKNQKGFSLIELMIAMTIILIVMGIASTLLKTALGSKVRESRRTDALTAAQAALNVMSREIANSGYGIFEPPKKRVHQNGIVLLDSNATQIRVRSNIKNSNLGTYDSGEDVTYYYDSTAQSIVRYDKTPKNWAVSTETYPPSYVINRVSSVSFQYYNYTETNTNPSPSNTPTEDTARVKITVVVQAEDVQNVPSPDVTLTSDVTLRNSKYMMLYY